MKAAGITLTCDQAVLHPFFTKRQGWGGGGANRKVSFNLHTNIILFFVLFGVYILSRALDGLLKRK